MLRVLNELAGRLNGDGLPGRRLARATAAARAKAWGWIVARHGQLPAVRVAGVDLTRPGANSGRANSGGVDSGGVDSGGVDGGGVDGGLPRPVLVVRLDATLIEADSDKDGAAGTYKGGYGFHPLTAFCSNVGDSLAVMLRPGNAGSFTAADHLLVLDAALGQIPAPWRTDILVTIDGAGASHAVIEHLTSLNTAVTHGRRGRRVEYSIGWPVDDRTQTGIDQLRESDWGVALTADGRVDPKAAVADLTGILRHSVAGDLMAGWPPDQRIIVRRIPRPAGEQPTLKEHPDWRYGAFTTNTPTGQLQWLDARHRTQAHIEDKMKELKACGGDNLPSTDWGRNSAWLQLAALACTLNAWLRHLALHGTLAKAEPKALRCRLLGAPARHIAHARQTTLLIPPGWKWANDLATGWKRLQALHPG